LIILLSLVVGVVGMTMVVEVEQADLEQEPGFQ